MSFNTKKAIPFIRRRSVAANPRPEFAAPLSSIRVWRITLEEKIYGCHAQLPAQRLRARSFRSSKTTSAHIRLQVDAPDAAMKSLRLLTTYIIVDPKRMPKGYTQSLTRRFLRRQKRL